MSASPGPARSRSSASASPSASRTRTSPPWGGSLPSSSTPTRAWPCIPVPLAEPVRHRIEDNLVLFYTGIRRPASDVLLAQEQLASAQACTKLDDNLDAVSV